MTIQNNPFLSIEIDRDSVEPVWVQLKRAVEGILDSGDLRGGTRLPSLRKIGSALSISYLTVSKAMNQLVSEGLLESREGAGIFVAEKSVDNLKSVALILGSSSTCMGMRYIRGVSAGLNERGVDLILFENPGNDRSTFITSARKFIRRGLAENRFQGLIVYSDHILEDIDFADEIIPQSPIVVLNSKRNLLVDGIVNSDDDLGMKLVVQELKRKKRENAIIFCPEENHSIGSWRRASFEKHAKDNNIKSELIDNVLGDDSGYLNAMRIVVEKKKCEALVCWNDLAAIGAMRLFNSQGVKIPEDISIVGYGNLDLAKSCNPPLSSVEQNFEEMGRKAVEIIHKAIKKRSYKNPEIALIETKLVLRDSL